MVEHLMQLYQNASRSLRGRLVLFTRITLLTRHRDVTISSDYHTEITPSCMEPHGSLLPSLLPQSQLPPSPSVIVGFLPLLEQKASYKHHISSLTIETLHSNRSPRRKALYNSKHSTPTTNTAKMVKAGTSQTSRFHCHQTNGVTGSGGQ